MKEKNTNFKNIRHIIVVYLTIAVATIVSMIIIYTQILINAYIPSESMENTLMTGDRVIGNRLAYKLGKDPKRFDIVMFYAPDDPVFRHRFVIQLVDLSQMDATKTAIENVDGIDKVNAPTEFADKFISVRNVISIVSLVLIAILGFVSLFIMSNTIKLATYGRREEIAIMKMVGASNSFIRCPFIIEGLVLGIAGGGLAFLAQWGLYKALETKVSQSLAISFVQIVPFSQVWVIVLVAFLAVGVLVGAVGGVIAIRNYLKV